MQPEILLFFAKYIELELGIVYAEHNYFQLQNRLEDIAKILLVDSVERLYANAKEEIAGQFKQLLLDLATNNETSFFRDQKVFQAIEDLFLPLFVQESPKNSQLRVWSAASSSGQEALSVSMVLKEWNLKNSQNIQFSVLGTDISERILKRAKAAQYTQLEVQRGLPQNLLNKYFIKNSEERWEASSELMSHIQFRKQNLLEPFLFTEKFHLIFCRNVLIYQNIDSKKEILKRLTEMLHPGGFLVLGSGESLMGLSNDYEQSTSNGAVIYRKKEMVLRAA
jgi:chemotaxis protein methyltransferase CheR